MDRVMIRLVCLVCFAWLALSRPASAITILLDYTYDIQDGGNFFGTHAAAKATLEQAAADLGAVIASPLAAVNGGTFTGNNQGTVALFDWDFAFDNPVTGAPLTIDNINVAADTVRIFVGMSPLSGSTLGQGGPGLGVSFSGSSILEPRWGGAVAAAETASNAVMPRGAGPTMFSFSDDATVGSTTAHYDVRAGAVGGVLTFDNDINNDTVADSFGTLDNFWHFELTSPSVDGQNDFYSVALHEMLHALGIGTAETWDALRSNSTWLGSNAIALVGNGNNLVTASHIREGAMSFRLSDNAPQEVVMDPSITAGTRKSLTQLDLAFLRDLGYTTVPEPSTFSLLAIGFLSAGSRRRRRR